MGIACIFGLLLSGMSIDTAIQRSKEKQLFLQSKAIHHDLKNLATLKTASVKAELKAQTKYQIGAKEGLTEKLARPKLLKRSSSFDSYFYRNHPLWNISHNLPEASKCGFENLGSPFSR